MKVDVSYWIKSGMSDCAVATCSQQISGCYKPVLTFLFLVLYCHSSAGPCNPPFQGSFLHRHASVADSTYIRSHHNFVRQLNMIVNELCFHNLITFFGEDILLCNVTI